MKRGIALDIDETLSSTLGSWLGEMQKLFGNPENLTLYELITKYRLAQNVPYWQTPEAFEWMESKRNDSEYQTIFEPMPGAIDGVLGLNKIIPIYAYLTVRPEGVYDGTKKWLKKHGFPDAEIIARPNHIPHTDGNQWKAGRLLKLFPEVIGIVDDNAGLLKFLPKSYKGHVFLYSHKDIPPDSPVNVYACPDWESVVQKAKEIFFLLFIYSLITVHGSQFTFMC